MIVAQMSSGSQWRGATIVAGAAKGRIVDSKRWHGSMIAVTTFAEGVSFDPFATSR
jgi:hypothetical protein